MGECGPVRLHVEGQKTPSDTAHLFFFQLFIISEYIHVCLLSACVVARGSKDNFMESGSWN